MKKLTIKQRDAILDKFAEELEAIGLPPKLRGKLAVVLYFVLYAHTEQEDKSETKCTCEFCAVHSIIGAGQ